MRNSIQLLLHQDLYSTLEVAALRLKGCSEPNTEALAWKKISQNEPPKKLKMAWTYILLLNTPWFPNAESGREGANIPEC